ncbi:MAG: acyl carrier protein [Pseudomonadota bacterium]
MRQQLIDFINDDLLADQDGVTVGGDDELLVEGYVDSLGVMRLVSFIESELQIRVPPQHITIEHFASVDVLVAYLEGQRAEAAAQQ